MNKRGLFNKYKSGKDFIKAAEKSENVVSIRQGKGDHFTKIAPALGERSGLAAHEFYTNTRTAR
jgi:hypothetical protein